MYNQSSAEVSVVPAGGGVPTRLKANDPAACSGITSPGVTNSWPKWSPDVESCPDGNTYYWLVFSSTRENIPFNAANLQNGVAGPTSQLYITGVVVDGSGTITTYPALYLWNQPAGENNHTPAWDYFAIPPPPAQ